MDDTRTKTTASSDSKSMSMGSSAQSGQDDIHSMVNLGFMTCFVEMLESRLFQKTFNLNSFKIDMVMKWIIVEGSKPNALKCLKNLYNLTTRKLEKAKTAASKKTIQMSKKKNDEVETETSILMSRHIRQIFRVSQAVYTYGSRDRRILELFRTCFVEDKISQRFIVGSAYLTNVFPKAQRSVSYSKTSKLELGAPSNLEAILYFHCIRLVMGLKEGFKLSHTTGSRIGFAIQTLCKAWVQLLRNVKTEKLGMMTTLIMPYIIYESDRRMFRVLKSRAEGYSNSGQEVSLLNTYVTKDANHVSATAWNRTNEMDVALRCIISMLFVNMESLITNLYLYKSSETDLLQWKVLVQYDTSQMENGLPPVFHTLSDEVCKTLGIEKPNPPNDDDDQVVAEVLHISDDEMIKVSDEDILGKRRRNKDDEQDDRSNGKNRKQRRLVDEPLNVSIKPGRSSQMSTVANEVMDELNVAMTNYFCVFENSFRDIQGDSLDRGCEITGNVDLILTSPPRRTVKFSNKEDDSVPDEDKDYDVITLSEMDDFVKICGDLLKVGGHGIIFCSPLQFHLWFHKLLSVQEEVEDFESDPSGNTKKMEKVFQVEDHPLTLVKSAGGRKNMDRKNLHHEKETDIAIHFWRKGLSNENAWKLVNYNSVPRCPTTHPAWSNVITNISHLPEHEVIYDTTDGSKQNTTEKREQFRPDQISVALMMDLIEKFTKEHAIVVDPFAGTYPVFKACLKLPKHRRFIGCDIDTDCLYHVEDDLIQTYARLIISSDSDLNPPNEKLKLAAQTLVSEMEQLKVNRRASAWTVPQGLVSMQTFPPYIIQMLCNYHRDMGLFIRGKHRPMLQWTSEWNRRMNSMDMNVLLAHECYVRNVSIRKSTIKSPIAGDGLFAEKDFLQGEVIGYYYGSLVYGDIGKKKKLSTRYGEGILSVGVDEFNRWAIEIQYKFIDSTGNPYSAWIAPAPFCCCRYLNDPRYHESDKTTKEERDSRPRVSNTNFTLDSKAKVNRDFERYNVIAVTATKFVKRGSELFIDYGTNYQFGQ